MRKPPPHNTHFRFDHTEISVWFSMASLPVSVTKGKRASFEHTPTRSHLAVKRTLWHLRKARVFKLTRRCWMSHELGPQVIVVAPDSLDHLMSGYRFPRLLLTCLTRVSHRREPGFVCVFSTDTIVSIESATERPRCLQHLTLRNTRALFHNMCTVLCSTV